MIALSPIFVTALQGALLERLLPCQAEIPTIPFAGMPAHEALNQVLGLKPDVDHWIRYQAAVQFLQSAIVGVNPEHVPPIVLQACEEPSSRQDPGETLIRGVLEVFEESLERVLMQSKPVIYADGTLVSPVYYKDGSLGAIKVVPPGGRKEITYERTGRPLSEYSVPLDLSKLCGQKVLDVGTGDGVAVEQMRESGVLAEGLDIFLTTEQKAKGYFHQGDIVQTGLPDGQYDSVIANHTVFTYIAARRGESDFYYGLRVMKELARIIRPGGGQILIGGTKAHNLRDIIEEIPALIIRDHSVGPADGWIVIQRE